jgi:AraC-like DNA-binding protein
MLNSQSAMPCRALRSYVRAYAQRQIENALGIVQPYVACLEPTLSLDFHNSTHLEFDGDIKQIAPRRSLVGPQTRRQGNVLLEGRVDTFGVFFQPLGCWQLFRVPYGILVNHYYTAEDVLGGAIKELWQRMGDCVAFEGRVAMVEEFLLRRAAHVSHCTPVMRSALHSFEEHGTIQIKRLAYDAALSVRHFERSFLRDIGVSPKLFARIARCERALDAKLTAPRRSWLNIAHYFGYHDQMHMIRDFQGLNGATPSEIVLRLVDMRPEALTGAAEDASASAIGHWLE